MASRGRRRNRELGRRPRRGGGGRSDGSCSGGLSIRRRWRRRFSGAEGGDGGVGSLGPGGGARGGGHWKCRERERERERESEGV